MTSGYQQGECEVRRDCNPQLVKLTFEASDAGRMWPRWLEFECEFFKESQVMQSLQEFIRKIRIFENIYFRINKYIYWKIYFPTLFFQLFALQQNQKKVVTNGSGIKKQNIFFHETKSLLDKATRVR